MGLVLFGALGLYLLISIAVVKGCMAYVRRKGGRPGRWGWGAALVMYLIPFWDWVPTVATHQYYCATEAGFWVFKTPVQWNKENPGVMETLVENRVPLLKSHVGDQNSWTDEEALNQRILLQSKRTGPIPIHQWKREGNWIDSKTNEVLARYVDFYSSYEKPQGGWSGWKFWLSTDHCSGYEHSVAEFRETVNQFKGAKN